jgi:hypothetical protein
MRLNRSPRPVRRFVDPKDVLSGGSTLSATSGLGEAPILIPL